MEEPGAFSFFEVAATSYCCDGFSADETET